MTPTEQLSGFYRDVNALANTEADALKIEYIGTEHLLLGFLASDEGQAVLQRLSVNVDDLKSKVLKFAESGPDVVVMGKRPLTPRAKRIVEFALEECGQEAPVTAGHLLFGLVKEREGVAGELLAQAGLTIESVRAAIAA